MNRLAVENEDPISIERLKRLMRLSGCDFETRKVEVSSRIGVILCEEMGNMTMKRKNGVLLC
jgi:hypothetical protein